MKQIYFLLFCLLTVNAIGQQRALMPQMQKAWDATYTNCDGDNWTFKTVEELKSRTESPYIKNNSYASAGDDGNYYSTFEIFDLSNNNLSGLIPQTFIKNDTYNINKMVWRMAGAVKIKLSHNSITSVPNRLGLCDRGFIHTLRVDNNELTSFHSDDFRTFTGSGNINLYTGCKVLTLHQNEISSLKSADLADYASISSLIHNKAEEVRIDNNRLDFNSLCEVVPFIITQYGERGNSHKGNPDCNFDYFPQKPLGQDVPEINDHAGTTHSLNFSLTHAQNVYTWMLNGKEILPLKVGKNLNINLSAETAGVYVCKVTNPNLQEVSLYSKDMAVFMNKDGNEAIEDFQILHDPITSDFPEGAIVADFQGEDPNGDVVYYRLIEGAVNNSSFRIKEGKTLISAETLFDRHYLGEYKVLVEAYDIYGGKKQKEFTITKGEGGGTALPEDITLSSSKVNENSANVVIGTLAAVGVEGYTFELANEADENFFVIEGSELKTKVELDYETQKMFNLRIKAVAADGTQMKKDFTIEVNDVNDAPYSVLLTTNIALIDVNSGAFIGQLVATDQDPTDVNFTFTLVAGEGDIDNGDFVIQNNRLLTARKFIEADLGQKSIRVQVKDDENAALEMVLEINIQGEVTENLVPRGIGLSNNVLWNEFKVGDIISYIFMSDPEGVKGTFSTTSEFININGNAIKLVKLPEDKDVVDIEITGNDGENEISATFNFYYESGTTDLKSTQQSAINVYPNPATNYIKFSEIANGHVYSLSGKKLKSFSQTDNVFVGDLESGAYILKLQTHERIINTKFIKK